MTRNWLANTRKIWVLIVMGAILLIGTNLPWQLDDYDQAKQAYTSFEMVKEGHWLYQHTPHERIATKPPLIGWTSAAIYLVTRSWAIGWRLPSLLAAIALAFLLFRAGNVYGQAGGVFATSAFVFNLLTPRLSTLVRTDMPLALAISAIGLLIWNKLRLREQWNQQDRWILFGLLTGAMLIKGPIVYAFLLPGLVVLRLIRCSHGARPPCEATRNPSSRPRHSEAATSTGWWPWMVSLGIFLLWVIGGSKFVPGFYDQVVVREFLGRFGETVHRPQPLLFYLPHLLHKFFPWSILIIVLAVLNFRVWKLDEFKPSRSWRAVFREISPQTWWLICWSLGGLIVMSLIPSKRVDRIFPVIPPLCLLMAAQLGYLLPNERIGQRVRKWGEAAILVSVLFTAGYSGFKVYTGYRDHRDALVRFGREVRQQASERHWRYAVVESNDEGLLLYLDQTHFVRPETAATDLFELRTVDALVVGSDDPRWRNAHPESANTVDVVACTKPVPKYCLVTRN